MSTVLITGCSSGLGFVTAQTLVAKGHTVVATMRALEGRNADAASKLQAACEGQSGTLHLVDLDVSDDASVAAAVSRSTELAGALDVVVHNAAYGTGGLMETIPVEQMRKVFEVNVFGPQRLSRAVLPSMRARKQGLLIFVSSTIARIPFPNFGAYGPSKVALESIAENYAAELRPFAVDVTIVQPGGYATSFFNNMQASADAERVASYGEVGEAAAAQLQGMAQMMSAPEVSRGQEVADAIAELVDAPAGQRPLRKVVDLAMGEAVEAINGAISAIVAKVFEGMAAAAAAAQNQDG